MDVRDEGSGEILIQALNCDRATSLLGWHPDAPLKIGLDWTSVWYKNYFKENPPCA
jgi:nucleoside-diphosphate-sugar epimerase